MGLLMLSVKYFICGSGKLDFACENCPTNFSTVLPKLSYSGNCVIKVLFKSEILLAWLGVSEVKVDVR